MIEAGVMYLHYGGLRFDYVNATKSCFFNKNIHNCFLTTSSLEIRFKNSVWFRNLAQVVRIINKVHKFIFNIPKKCLNIGNTEILFCYSCSCKITRLHLRKFQCFD